MDSLVNVISILWIVSGALGVIVAFFVFLFLMGISFIPDMGYEAPLILRWVAVGGGLFIAVLSIPEIIAGAGLLKLKEWGRIMTLIVSFLNLVSFPIGTALGVYSIVILLKEDTVKIFQGQN